MEIITSTTVLLTISVGFCGFLLFYILKLIKNEQAAMTISSKKGTDKCNEQKKTPNITASIGGGGSGGMSTKSKKKPSDKHSQSTKHSQWLLTTLKGHTGQVLNIDISTNSKYLASCSEDRTVLLWDIRELIQDCRHYRSIRVNIEFDYATFVCWSPDSKAFLIHKHNENTIEVYKIEKKNNQLGQAVKMSTFPKIHDVDVVGFRIATNGKYIVSCSNRTDLVLLNLKGDVLSHLDTYLMTTMCAKISPCSRFIVASGFAPDVKVWEVLYTTHNNAGGNDDNNHNGDIKDVKRIFDLSGHTSGVYDVCFDSNSTRIATISKDGTWRLYDINVDYKRGEDPHVITSGTYEQTSNLPLIALSPDAQVLVIANGNSLYFYNLINGDLDHTIHDTFIGNITTILFDSSGKYLLISGDKHIKIYHNITGYRCQIQMAKDKLKQLQRQQQAAMKERLEQLIKDSQDRIAAILGN